RFPARRCAAPPRRMSASARRRTPPWWGRRTDRFSPFPAGRVFVFSPLAPLGRGEKTAPENLVPPRARSPEASCPGCRVAVSWGPVFVPGPGCPFPHEVSHVRTPRACGDPGVGGGYAAAAGG